MNFSLSFLVSLLIVLVSASSVNAGQCYLCSNPGITPVRWNYRFANGYTCADIYQFLPRVQEGASICTNGRTMARNACCNRNAVVAASPTRRPTPPAYQGPVGSEPRCPICRNGGYPRSPNAIIIARYVGEFTCAQLYNRGNHGLIPGYMCGPLQDFAGSVCGCGSSTSSGTSIYADAPGASPGTRNLRGGASDDEFDLEDAEAMEFELAMDSNEDELLEGDLLPELEKSQLSAEELRLSFVLEEEFLPEEEEQPSLSEARPITAEDLHFSTPPMLEE